MKYSGNKERTFTRVKIGTYDSNIIPTSYATIFLEDPPTREYSQLIWS